MGEFQNFYLSPSPTHTPLGKQLKSCALYMILVMMCFLMIYQLMNEKTSATLILVAS